MAEPLDPTLLTAVRAMVAREAALPIERVKAEGVLVGYGIDSVRVVELLDEASEHFGVKLDEGDLRRFVTVADVARCIAARLPTPGAP